MYIRNHKHNILRGFERLQDREIKMNFPKSSLARQSRRLPLVLMAVGLIILPAAVSALAAGDVGPWTGTSNLSVPSTTAGAVHITVFYITSVAVITA